MLLQSITSRLQPGESLDIETVKQPTRANCWRVRLSEAKSQRQQNSCERKAIVWSKEKSSEFRDWQCWVEDSESWCRSLINLKLWLILKFNRKHLKNTISDHGLTERIQLHACVLSSATALIVEMRCDKVDLSATDSHDHHKLDEWHPSLIACSWVGH